MKRQISKMLAAMAALLFGYTALAAFELTINDGILTGFTGDVPANLEIPETVVTIDDSAFEGLEGLISVNIPTNVTYIGESAFAGCTNLAEVTFEDATPVTLESGNVGFTATLEIGAFAFDGCTSLTGIIIPAHAETIGESAFDGCTALEWVTFAANGDVTESYLEVCSSAFAGCEALETVTFEDRLYDPDNDVYNTISIGSSAFDGCAALTDLYLGEGVAEIGEYAFGGIGIEELTIPASVNYIGDGAFADCENLADVYFAGPDVFGDEYYVEMDEDSVFAGTPYGNRFRLDIDGDGVVGYKGEIPEGEFVDLEIPDFVTWIGDSAFEGLEGLISVNIPTNVTYIGESAFAGCTNLEEVVFEAKDVEQVEYSWMDEYDVVHNGTYFGFNETLEIGMNAFAGCTALAFVDIPAHVSAVYEFAFAGCTALEGVVFMSNWDEEQSYLTVCDYAFEGCEALQSVLFEDYQWDPDNDVFNETYINTGVFEGCEALTELYLGDGVVEIGESAFSGIGIETLEIPASVNYIGDGAFADCENLADVYFAGYDVYGGQYEIDYDDDSVFAGTPYGSHFRLAFDDDGIVGYKGEIPEGEFVDLEIPDFVTWIGDSAFEGLEGLISVNIPTNVTYIGESAFAGCINLEEIEFEGKDAVELESDCIGFSDALEIGASAFSGCEALTYLELPAHVSYVCEYAFEGCSSLESVTFAANEDVTKSWLEIGEGAFAFCDALESVTFEDRPYDPDNDIENEIYIGAEAFAGANALTEDVDPSHTVTAAPLTDLYLGEGVVGIGEFAFFYIGIESLDVPASVHYIGDRAFGYCKNLADVYFAGYDVYGEEYEIDMDLESAFEETPWLDAYLNLPIPGNDNFADAEAVEGMDGEVEGWNIGASIEEGESIGHYDGEDYSFVASVWYKWTAPESGTFSFGVAGANFDSVIGVYRGSSVGGLATVAFNDDTDADGFGSFTAFDAVAGATYYIAVGGYYEGDVGTFSLVWAPYEWNVEFEIDENGVLQGADFGDLIPQTLTIPEGVTAIADGVFGDQVGVTTVNLPSTLRSIGAYAFAWCEDLTAVNGLTDAIEVGMQAFLATPFNESRPFGLDVVDGCVVGFHGPCPSAVVLPDGVTNIAEFAFCYWNYCQEKEVYDEEANEWYYYEVSSLANLTSVTVPDSVASIGELAFEDCTNLVSVCVGDPEVLIEGSAFAGCTALTAIEVEKAGHTLVGWDLFREKNPGYWSARWDDVGGSNIWEYVEEETDIVPTGTVVRVESIETLVYGLPTDAMRTNWVWDAETNDYVVDSVTVVTNYLSGVWATPAWSINQYTVMFDANGGNGSMPAQTFTYDEMKELSECTFEWSAHEFVGWATSASSDTIAYLDGELVENLTYEPNGVVTLYALWERSSLWPPVPGGEGSSGEDGDGLFDGSAAKLYDGYVHDADGNLVGTIQAKTAKVKVDGKTGAQTSKVTVVVQLASGKKQTVKGSMDAATGQFSAADKSGVRMDVVFGANGVSGTFGSYLVDGAENKFASKDSADKLIAAAAMKLCQGVYTMAWRDGDGWSGLSLTIGAKGKSKVAGILSNGVKVSVKSQLLVGDDGVCVVPVVVAKKAQLAFNVWITKDEIYVAGLGDSAVISRPGVLAADAAFRVSKAEALWSSISGTVIADYIPDGAKVTSNGGKWVLPKAGKVVYKNGAVDESKLGENPSGLKLTYKAKDGSFKGSFKVYFVNGAKAKATTVNVTGVVIDGVGYGTATVKGKGEAEVTIGPVK